MSHILNSHILIHLIESSNYSSATSEEFFEVFWLTSTYIIFVLSSMDLIFDELFKNCLIFPTICGFFGLCIITAKVMCVIVELTDFWLGVVLLL